MSGGETSAFSVEGRRFLHQRRTWTIVATDLSEPAWRLDAAPGMIAPGSTSPGPTSPGDLVLHLTGDWIARSARIPVFPAERLSGQGHGATLVLDTREIGRWDSGLIAFLWDVKQAAIEAGVALDPRWLSDSARTLVGLLPDKPAPAAAPRRRRFNPLASLGESSLGMLAEIGVVATLLGATARGAMRALARRARMRSVDLLGNISDAGPSALAIVSVVNFLVGAILAFVGAVQLRKFAADIYVANLVGLALVREMAAVMTAIVMAGRTGGAYAARIATMQGNEEIDALTVFGIPVADYIVLPAILALAFTMPLLYLYGCLVGILGGFVVSISMLTITSAGYLNQTIWAVGLDQFVFGFIKSIAFAILIGVLSCRIGLKAGRSAADVGTAATRAVVAGIVGVIALDAVFAVIADMIDL